MRKTSVAAILFGAVLLGCGGGGGGGGYTPPPATDGGGGGGGGGGGSQYAITISNFTFSPQNLTVPAGATVTVTNMDSAPHSVTSESAPGMYVAGAVNGVSFDTGIFSDTATFTIPAGAPSGTVVPYFCIVHKAGMRNQGQITIQ